MYMWPRESGSWVKRPESSEEWGTQMLDRECCRFLQRPWGRSSPRMFEEQQGGHSGWMGEDNKGGWWEGMSERKLGWYHGGGVLGTTVQTSVFLKTLVTMLHIRFSDLIHLRAESLYHFSNFTLFLPVLSPWQPILLSVSMSFILIF